MTGQKTHKVINKRADGTEYIDTYEKDEETHCPGCGSIAYCDSYLEVIVCIKCGSKYIYPQQLCVSEDEIAQLRLSVQGDKS